jgi:methyltransferase (TIGR00027 family)
VKAGTPSATAEANAAFRAAELLLPLDQQVCRDPFAIKFLGAKFRIIVKSRLLARIALWYADRIIPGAPGGVVARTRYMDDRLKERIDDGISQLVLLGAGYDARAFRIDGLKGKVKVFEVDHPDTQRAKVEKIRKMFGGVPDQVVYVPVDFDKDKLGDRLFESGYDGDAKTFFIWEGVTQYLTAAGVDETLAFVAGNSGKGSSIIFDYAYQSVLDGTAQQEEAQKWRKTFERRNEPPAFGIDETAVGDFLQSRGFAEVRNASMESIKGLYFKGANERRKVTTLGGVVHATVAFRE